MANELPKLAGGLKRVYEVYCETLLEHGWWPRTEMPAGVFVDEVTLCVEVYLDKRPPSDIDDHRTCHYEQDLIERLIAQSWSNSELLRQRWSILRAALDAHYSQAYELSVPALCAQTEGVLVDNIRTTGKVSHDEIARHVRERLAPLSWGLADEAEYIARFVSEQFLGSFRRGEETPGPLNRHAVLHGIDCDYAREANSLRAILLLDTIHRCLLGSIGKPQFY